MPQFNVIKIQNLYFQLLLIFIVINKYNFIVINKYNFMVLINTNYYSDSFDEDNYDFPNPNADCDKPDAEADCDKPDADCDQDIDEDYFN